MINKAPLKAQVRWQCRRGMLELDIVLLSFFDTHYDTLSLKEQVAFTHLLEASDPDLYAWLSTGEEPALSDLTIKDLIILIRQCLHLP